MEEKIDEILGTVKAIKEIVQNLTDNHLDVIEKLKLIDRRIDDLETTVLNDLDLPDNNPIKRRLANIVSLQGE